MSEPEKSEATVLSGVFERSMDGLVLPIEEPVERKRPGLAAGLSAICPGLGHLYLGKYRTGLLAGFFFLVSIPMVLSNGGMWLQGALLFPCLYVFAVVDSYWAAREWNAGADALMVRANPRIAALLNSVTKGFGYFYLGDTIKGVFVFLGVVVLQVVALQSGSLLLSVAALSLQIVLAADAYRIARHRLAGDYPGLKAAVDDANPNDAEVGWAHGVAAVFAIGFVVLVGGLRVRVGHAYTRGGGTYDSTPDGLIFTNPKAGYRIAVPPDWTPAQEGEAVAAMTGDGCVLYVFDLYSLGSNALSFAQTNERALKKSFPDATVRVSSGFHTPQPPRDVLVADFHSANGVAIERRFLHFPRVLHSITLMEGRAVKNTQCISKFEQIEKTVQIP